MKLQSAYGQLPDSGWPVSWLGSTQCGVPDAHQPQPTSDVQSPQLSLNWAQKPLQLPGQVANELPAHELAAELDAPPWGSHLPLDRQNPQPSSEVQASHVVNCEHGSPTTAYSGRDEEIVLPGGGKTRKLGWTPH